MSNSTSLDWYNTIYGFLPIVIVVPPLAIPANSLVMRLLLFKPGICCTSEIFTLQLAVFDFFFCVIILIEYLRLLCFPSLATSNFVAWSLNQMGGPILLCLLSLDSYVAVCHPLVFPRLKDPRLRLSLCFGVNVFTAISCWLVKFSQKYKWTVISVLMCCAILITSTCNILVLRSLRHTGPSRKQPHPLKRRAFKIVLTSFALVILLYSPSLLEYLLRVTVPRIFRPFSVLSSSTYAVLSLSSVAQPLCYLKRTKQLPIPCRRGSAAAARAVASG